VAPKQHAAVRPLRILQVTDSFLPVVGGIERYVATLSQRLAAEGAAVTVATLDYPNVPTEENVDGYRVVRLKGLTAHLRRFASDPGHYFHPTVPDPKLVRELQRIVDEFQPDIVHAHGWIVESCVLLRRGPATALVATLHEYGVACAKKTYTRVATGCPEGPALMRCIACSRQTYGLPKAVVLSTGLRLVRPLHRRVDRWIAVSAAVKQASLVATRCSEDEIDVVPGFVEDEVARLVAAPVTFSLPKEPFLLFVGAMGPHKGLDVLLQARRRIPGRPPLVILGTPRADSPDLTDDGVTVQENVPHPQVIACFAAAAVGVVPSVWPEPFGLVAIECLSVGTPVVVSDTGGLGEIVRDGVDGLRVPAGDADALARALERVLYEPGLASRLATAAVERAKEYEIRRVLPRLLVSYETARRHRRERTGAA
jgi:glycosyltransferase involved in cell wall biosynthesis